MASLNINNHIKSSLQFVHCGTVVLLRYFGSFSNQRSFQASTLVCATEQAFVSNKENTQKSMGFKSENEGHISSLQNFGKWQEHHSVFLTCENVVLVDFWGWILEQTLT